VGAVVGRGRDGRTISFRSVIRALGVLEARHQGVDGSPLFQEGRELLEIARVEHHGEDRSNEVQELGADIVERTRDLEVEKRRGGESATDDLAAQAIDDPGLLLGRLAGALGVDRKRVAQPAPALLRRAA
jgi:hypothetical protein